MREYFNLALLAIIAVAAGFLVFLAVLPIAAYFLKLLWNLIAISLYSSHTITYVTGLKLCFYFYVLKGLFGIKLSISTRE